MSVDDPPLGRAGRSPARVVPGDRQGIKKPRRTAGLGGREQSSRVYNWHGPGRGCRQGLSFTLATRPRGAMCNRY
ncbi:hypothetical protein PCLA_05r0506 [Pseudomonas citronellolis]|nr:hypothetical protein PCLA_05r0506 [Pseudomonas citronellolis]